MSRFSQPLRLNPKGLETEGFDGGGDAFDRFGLLTRGLAWQITSLWTGATGAITTSWVSQSFGGTTTWASKTPSITTTWVQQDKPFHQ